MHNNSKTRNKKPNSDRRKRRTPASTNGWNRITPSLMRRGPAPNSMMVTLPYVSSVLIASSTSFLVLDYRINSLTAIDPLVSSPAIGSTSWSNIYSQYIVLGIRMRFNLASNEPSVPQTFGLLFADWQPSVGITTLSEAEKSLMLAPSTGPKIVGETTGASLYKSPWYTVPPQKILGNKRQYNADKGFSGTFTTGPTSILWAGFVIHNVISATLGARVDLEFEFHTELFSLSPLLLS